MSGVDHIGFIVAAYAVTAGAIGLMIIALLVDNRTQKRLLARFGTKPDDRS